MNQCQLKNRELHQKFHYLINNQQKQTDETSDDDNTDSDEYRQLKRVESHHRLKRNGK
jgi:hypothetical protein